jgi:hypothetical protein
MNVNVIRFQAQARNFSLLLILSRQARGPTPTCLTNAYRGFLMASVVWWSACWPLVPEFAGSIPTEAVGFFPM